MCGLLTLPNLTGTRTTAVFHLRLTLRSKSASYLPGFLLAATSDSGGSTRIRTAASFDYESSALTDYAIDPVWQRV